MPNHIITVIKYAKNAIFVLNLFRIHKINFGSKHIILRTDNNSFHKAHSSSLEIFGSNFTTFTHIRLLPK